MSINTVAEIRLQCVVGDYGVVGIDVAGDVTTACTVDISDIDGTVLVTGATAATPGSGANQYLRWFLDLSTVTGTWNSAVESDRQVVFDWTVTGTGSGDLQTQATINGPEVVASLYPDLAVYADASNGTALPSSAFSMGYGSPGNPVLTMQEAYTVRVAIGSKKVRGIGTFTEAAPTPSTAFERIEIESIGEGAMTLVPTAGNVLSLHRSTLTGISLQCYTGSGAAFGGSFTTIGGSLKGSFNYAGAVLGSVTTTGTLLEQTVTLGTNTWAINSSKGICTNCTIDVTVMGGSSMSLKMMSGDCTVDSIPTGKAVTCTWDGGNVTVGSSFSTGSTFDLVGFYVLVDSAGLGGNLTQSRIASLADLEGNVTNLAADAVDATSLANNAITAAKIATDAITSSQLAQTAADKIAVTQLYEVVDGGEGNSSLSFTAEDYTGVLRYRYYLSSAAAVTAAANLGQTDAASVHDFMKYRRGTQYAPGGTGKPYAQSWGEAAS